MTTETVGSFITRLRVQRGLSQRALSRKLALRGIRSHETLRTWETDRVVPPGPSFEALLDVLEVSDAERIYARQIKGEADRTRAPIESAHADPAEAA